MNFRTIFLIVMMLFSQASMATVILLTDSDGQLIGATGIEIDGITYDVAFVDGTCEEVFDGCDDESDFLFTTAEEAEAASTALSELVFVDTLDGLFDSEPESTNGISNNSQGMIYTPFGFITDDIVALYQFKNDDIELDDIIYEGRAYVDTDLSTQKGTVWAVWSISDTTTTVLTASAVSAATSSATTISEPSQLSLFSLALFAVAGVMRTKKRKQNIEKSAMFKLAV